jgi:hypothetical protein
MVFTQASAEGANRLQEVLERYRIGSGQMVNKNKSAIFFSANATDEMKLAVHQGTEIPTEALVEKYLGLPTALGKSTDDHFDHIVATIKKLVTGWAPKLLNSAGREVLIKAICQAIPTYSMSCFKLSKKLCKKLQRWLLVFGGEVMNLNGGCIGLSGLIWPHEKFVVVWVLKTSHSSTKLC